MSMFFFCKDTRKKKLRSQEVKHIETQSHFQGLRQSGPRLHQMERPTPGRAHLPSHPAVQAATETRRHRARPARQGPHGGHPHAEGRRQVQAIRVAVPQGGRRGPHQGV